MVGSRSCAVVPYSAVDVPERRGRRRLVRQFCCARASACAIVLALSVTAIPVNGSRAPAAAPQAATAWRVSRMPWGDSDIPGIFTNRDVSGTPFERRAEFGTRDYLTEQEYSQRVPLRASTQDDEEGPLPALGEHHPGSDPPLIERRDDQLPTHVSRQHPAKTRLIEHFTPIDAQTVPVARGRGRSVDVDAAVDIPRTADARCVAPALRGRVPRRQLRDVQHAARVAEERERA